MKVLWVNNIAIPKIAKAAGIQSVPVGGWMVKLADMISTRDDIELSIAFPYEIEIEGRIDQISYYSFNTEVNSIKVCKLGGQTRRIEEIIRIVKPDCIHVFGTEYAHSYVFTEVAKQLGIIKKVVVSIQGMRSVYAKHYEAYLPHSVITGFSIRDIFKGNIAAGKRRFESIGLLEEETIRSVHHIIGRTDWDRACTSFLNPDAEYHFNNEMLRDSFYSAEPWEYEKCIPHSVFISQATQPLKGLHLAIEAIAILKPFYPDIRLRIAGKSYTQKKAYKRSRYEQYILGLINNYGLNDNVEFTGFLNEEQMVKEYQKCNAFICASSIENSPNSLCEAMVLGVPVVTSFTGGIGNLLQHNVEGYIYQADAYYMLAFYLRKVFENREYAKIMGNNARTKALIRHDVKAIVADLTDIYQKIRKD